MSITKTLRNPSNITFVMAVLVVVGVFVSSAIHAQTGIVANTAKNDASVYQYGCTDELALDEFYQADIRDDSAQKKALVSDELCFWVVGMKYSLIEKLARNASNLSRGVSLVRIYTAGNQKLSDYGESIELVVANKYLRNTKAEKSKRYAGYTQVAGLIPYKIWDKSSLRSEKVSFDIAVPLIDGRLPTKQELGAISRHLVKSEPRKYKRAFVGFYLPEMEQGAGSFATAHHNPKMEVQMLTALLYLYPQYKKFAE
ncbi:MAG: hypothetical protein MPJ22_13800 [Pirellulales bacterium]|nr:hypothetical protein [Alphaproteobacteria bacterium]MDA8032389.1 hypothetical protein [Alphaproteobacteria bacterium]MDA8043488.1 hypothetical protein [Pirellulales bacterium]